MPKRVKEYYDDGEVVIDANDQVWQRSFTGNCGWYGLGLIDEEYPDSSPARPLRRMIPADPDAPDVFRITYSDGSVKHGNRKVLGAVLGQLKNGLPWYKKPVKIEQIPSAAAVDVTSEFINS